MTNTPSTQGSFMLTRTFLIVLLFATATQKSYSTPNQTDTLSPIYSSDGVPFTIDIELASFSLPDGLQSYVVGSDKNKWLFLAGKTSGLHGFAPRPDDFPVRKQNSTAYVIDFQKKQVYQRSLLDSGLSPKQIAALSLTAPLFQQVHNTLYVLGGYGFNSSTQTFGTASTLTAVNIPEFIEWVQNPNKKKLSQKAARQISDPIFQVAGGSLKQENPHTPFLIVFGQNFQGASTDSNGVYPQQIRTFKLIDNGVDLAIFAKDYKPQASFYRRRDLNVVPIIQKSENSYKGSYIALSGVFTEDEGAWTVPVSIDAYGDSFMPDPNLESSFKQGMNNYICPCISVFSKKSNLMNIVLLGGISYETYRDGHFLVNPRLPFTNNVTTIAINENNEMTQHLMETTYPFIPSTFEHEGDPLLFGTSAAFIPVPHLSLFPNGVLLLEEIKEKTLIGYVVGGIASSAPNTERQSATIASPYIFQVFLTPK